MIVRLKFLLIIIISLLYCGSSLAQDAHFTLVAPPKDQPWTATFGMVQDAQGYLWIRTLEGLYKYDGHHYTIFQHDVSNPNSVASNLLSSAFADKDGSIWFGTVGKGLDKYDPVSGRFTHYRHNLNEAGSLADDNVAAVIRDHNGILWIGTGKGLDKFEPKTNSFIHFAHNDLDRGSLSSNTVKKLYEDREGTLWVGCGDTFPTGANKEIGGLNKLDKESGKFTRYMHDEKNPLSLIDNRIEAIFEDSRGTFWIGTAGDGLHTMDRKAGTFVRHLYNSSYPENLSRPPVKNITYYSDDFITFINEDVAGKIWIGTFSNGINLYDPATKKVTWYGTDPKCNVKTERNEFINSYKTHDGILWVMPFQGVELYKVVPYSNKLPYNHRGTLVNSFVEGTDSTLWMATGDGLLHKKKDNTFEKFYINEMPPGMGHVDKIPPWMNRLFFIEKDSEGKIWLSNWQGLYKFDPANKSFTSYFHQNGNPNSLIWNGIMYLKDAGANKLWIGTLKGLQLLDIKSGAFKNFINNSKDSTSISFNLIQCIAKEKTGTTWVSTDNGINRLDEKTGRFKHYLMNITTRYILPDGRGNLWAGTDQGLYKYDKNTDSFINFGKYRTAVFWISEDDDNNLWLHTNYGIIKVNTATLEAIVYGKSQGVSNGVNFGLTMRNGEILVGDTLGYFDFNPEKILHSNPAPTVVISDFYLGNTPVFPALGGVLNKPIFNTDEIGLSHNQNTFSFVFTGIDFTGEPGANQTLYKLENYDEQWRNEAANEAAIYYNVPPGDYIFKVKSINGNGLVAQKQIIITISQAWYKTLSAYIIFAILLITAIWGVIYYRSVALIKANRMLEHKVHTRTEEVLHQKEEIEAQRDNIEKTLTDLKSAQTQLIQSEKMASLGELTAGIAHEIQNPLNFVNNFSSVNIELIDELQEEIAKGNFEEVGAIAGDIKSNQQKINHHGERAGAIVKGMLEHSRTSKGERQPTDINALADEFFKLSYHGLRAKDKTFNAEMISTFAKNLPKVNTVQQDIGRVLLNLFNNAFYAVAEKAKTAGPGYKPTVKAHTETKGHQVIIKISDNGGGIPQTIADKVFQPFFTTKPTGQGTGLGLSISYDIVKAHEGEIKLTTTEGEGTEFIVVLPV